MPLYDYDCANCGQRFEVLRGVHADPPTECPLCGGGPIKKAFTTPAIHFKGSGWAKKERRATANAGATKAAGEGGAASATPGESGSTNADGATPSKASSGGSDGSSSASSDGGDGGGTSSTSSDGSKASKATTATTSTSKAKGD